MIEADRVHSTPRIDLPSKNLTRPLSKQEADRKKSLRTLRRLRTRARDEISRLIQFLDLSDPYVMTELEDVDDREEVGDTEPSLGSLDRLVDQTRWGGGCSGDTDAELDTADDEPSLGSLDYHHSQDQWAASRRRDLEQDDAESGIGDQDGLDEQVPFRDWQNVGMV